MRFFYVNRLDSGAITSTSAEATLPATNVANELKGKIWRSAPAAIEESLTVNFGAGTDITAVIIHAHTIDSNYADRKLESSANNFSSVVASRTITHAATTMGLVISSGDNSQYWRVRIADDGALQPFDVGRIFLGTYTDTAEEPDFDGVDIEWNDLSEKTKSKSGQTYTDQRGQFRKITVSFSQVSQATKAAIETIFNTVGTHTSFFIQIQTTGDMTEYLYVKFSDEPKPKVSGYDGTNLLWDLKLSFEEQL